MCTIPDTFRKMSKNALLMLGLSKLLYHIDVLKVIFFIARTTIHTELHSQYSVWWQNCAKSAYEQQKGCYLNEPHISDKSPDSDTTCTKHNYTFLFQYELYTKHLAFRNVTFQHLNCMSLSSYPSKEYLSDSDN